MNKQQPTTARRTWMARSIAWSAAAAGLGLGLGLSTASRTSWAQLAPPASTSTTPTPTPAPTSPAAASAPGSMRSVGVFSLLGDAVQVVESTDAPSDTRIVRQARESLDFKGIGFDNIALRVARNAVREAQPAAEVNVFKAPAALTVAQQRRLALDATQAEMPAWMVATIRENKLSHVVLITRTEGPANFRTADNDDIGRGRVDGIGFYIDTLYTIKNLSTGALSTGLLGPYTQIRLILMDVASAEVLQSYDVRDGRVWGSPEQQPKSSPWDFMSSADKVRVLRDMVETGMKRGMSSLLRKS